MGLKHRHMYPFKRKAEGDLHLPFKHTHKRDSRAGGDLKVWALKTGVIGSQAKKFW